MQVVQDEHATAAAAAAATEQVPKVVPLEIKKFQPIVQYITLATFSWDQDYDKVKVCMWFLLQLVFFHTLLIL